MKTWKRRWFVLADSCLYYFQSTTVSQGPAGPSGAAAANLVPVQDKDPIGIIPLENLGVRKLQDTSKPVPVCLPLY